jgi:hypothetical protein
MADSTQKKKLGRPRKPYTTGVARIPTPLMPRVRAMVEKFRAKANAEFRQQQQNQTP